MKRFIHAAMLLAALGTACAACRRETPGATLHRSVLLVTIDTLRADRVGRGVTPALDRLAAAGVRFSNARTTVPLTLPAHVTLMTGTLPPAHGVRDNGVVFDNRAPTLARAFHAAGYRTGAFVGAYVLDRRFGLADGFDTYDDRVPRDPDAAARLEAERRGEAVADAAIAWLDVVQPPFFLWVHLYDPHAPYDAPPAYRGGATAYDDEVKYADAQVARIVDRLGKRGMTDLVIVAAGDHGEGLGEHGEATHGLLAYDSTLRVPLIVNAPGLAPRDEARPVSLADVAPAVLRLAGVAGTLSEHASRTDLLAPGSGRDIYAESEYPKAAGWHPLRVLAGEQWKLVRSSEAELYDVAADPNELRNLAAERPNVVAAMSAELARLGEVGAGASSATIAPEAAERLRTLGYVSAASSSQSILSDAPNPARTIEHWTTFEGALAQLNAGRVAEAVPALRSLAARFPAGLVFHTSYARALERAGRAKEAVAVLKNVAAAGRADATLFHELAVAARSAGDSAEAMRAEQAALALEAESPAALNGLGLLHADAGRAGEAAAAFERAVKADPSNASYWANLGNARRELGDAAAADAAYRRALAIDPAHADAANGLGVVLVQGGKPGDAVPWFERALHRSPDFHEARLNLGIAFQESGQREKAAAVYRDLLARAPPASSRERRAAAELLRGLK